MSGEPATDDALDQLHRSEWSVGQTCFTNEGGTVVWVVDGCNGENRLRVEGETQGEAWRRALVVAKEVGCCGTDGISTVNWLGLPQRGAGWRSSQRVCGSCGPFAWEKLLTSSALTQRWRFSISV